MPPSFPLFDGRRARVEMTCKNGLAHLLALANLLNLARLERGWNEAALVEFMATTLLWIASEISLLHLSFLPWKIVSEFVPGAKAEALAYTTQCLR